MRSTPRVVQRPSPPTAPSGLSPRLSLVTRRQVFLIVDLAPEADIAELMYRLTWGVGTEPTFTPIMAPEVYARGIAQAMQAPAIG